MGEIKNTPELDKNTRTTDNNLLCASIPIAAKIIGVSRNTGYLMAKMGQLPTIQCGKRKKLVPMAALKRLLGDLPHNESDIEKSER